MIGICVVFVLGDGSKKNQQFFPHTDGVDYTSRMHSSPHKEGRYKSRVTLVLYLNSASSDFRGGGLRFLLPCEVSVAFVLAKFSGKAEP